MRPSLKIAAIALLCTAAAQGDARAMVQPSLKLEGRGGHQGGQLAAVYDACASGPALAVIGGSIAVWRSEMAEGRDTAAERATLEAISDDTDDDVTKDVSRCEDWRRQATFTVRSVRRHVGTGDRVED